MSSATFKITIKAFVVVAITMTMTLIVLSSISVNNSSQQEHADEEQGNHNNNNAGILPRRVSRFLAESDYNHHGRSLKPADHCNKNNEVCDIRYGNNFTCCGNKCFDLTIDQKNCGGCHNKCKFTDECCDGKCVNKVYDKRHCGRCNNKCLPGQVCLYGLCDYA